MSFLQVEHLHINLGEFHLRDISFSLERGDYLGVIGPTGAGKTIFLESIIGFWRPDNGTIYLEGRNLSDELPEKRQIGIVYQDYALLPHFTVFENIAYGLKKKERNKERIQRKVQEIAAILKIDHLLHRKPSTLSGGEQQRAALSRAMIVEPKLLLMDEPLSALDPQTRRKMRQLLRQVLKEQGTTVIHITHDLDDVWALANKVAIFEQGNLRQFGSLENVFQCPCSKFIADFVGATILEGIVKAKTREGMSVVNVNEFQLVSADEAVIGESVNIAIRPENIIISPGSPPHGTTQNIIKTTLEDLVNEGTTSLLLLRVHDTLLEVLVANNAVERYYLKPGETVYACINHTNVRIVGSASASSLQ